MAHMYPTSRHYDTSKWKRNLHLLSEQKRNKKGLMITTNIWTEISLLFFLFNFSVWNDKYKSLCRFMQIKPFINGCENKSFWPHCKTVCTIVETICLISPKPFVILFLNFCPYFAWGNTQRYIACLDTIQTQSELQVSCNISKVLLKIRSNSGPFINTMF
jgi:hypothetical protein